ncbi:MAG: hypothetical protein JWO57_2688 [Pseudonocardiales bacterium]|nr:hypothetical protein [Pseudonocardiales bacterium]
MNVDGDDPVELAPGVWQVRQPLSEEVPLYLHLVVGADAALVDGGLPSSLPAVQRCAGSGAVDQDLEAPVVPHVAVDAIGGVDQQCADVLAEIA